MKMELKKQKNSGKKMNYGIIKFHNSYKLDTIFIINSIN